jgi:probable rRNA maturation factor
MLGDIVISVETARRRAHGRRLGSELERLAVHGLCHLFGHDHHKPAEATMMFALEAKLRRLPLARPARTGGRASRGT